MTTAYRFRVHATDRHGKPVFRRPWLRDIVDASNLRAYGRCKAEFAAEFPGCRFTLELVDVGHNRRDA